MSATKQEPREEQNTCNTASEKTNEDASEEASGETSKEAGIETGADEGEGGFESLRSAAENQLGKRGRKIAEAFGEKAQGGDLNSAKFLVSVAKDKAGKGAGKKRRRPSTAERLAHELPWEQPPVATPEPEPLKPGDENVSE
jgi:hypothetical protein